MATGKINVSVDNIFPLIKKFLYSDHEIFLRELISNATDATLKLKHLTNIGETDVEYGNPVIDIKVDKENKKIFEGKVSSTGSSGQFASILPYMIGSLFANFPGANGQVKTIELREGDLLEQQGSW